MIPLFLALTYLAVFLTLWRFLMWRPRSLPGLTRQGTLLVGHRGVRGKRPENTLEAFRYAFEEGLDGVEFDVQRSRDGQLILYHDFEIEGQHVNQLSLEQLRSIDPNIPILDELFDLAKDYPGTLLNLELKSESFKTDGLERDTASSILASGLADRVIVSSFNPVSLWRLRLGAPSLRVGLLYAPDLPRYLRSGSLAGWLHVDALHPHESQVTPELVLRTHARGLKLNTWTVNDLKRISSLYALGVDAIMGDDPEVLRRAVPGHLEERDR